jgi:hypothetical protein
VPNKKQETGGLKAEIKPRSSVLARLGARCCARAASGRKMRRIAEKLVDCALNGEPWAIAQVADRIDGKAALSVDGVTFTHRYVVEVPAQLSEEDVAGHQRRPAAVCVS